MIKKILIVDDSPVSRKILKRCLPPDQEYEIHEAGDGLAGVDLFREVQPDVTFMDLTMPRMNGVEALREIKKLDAEAVIIVATADIQAKSITRVMDLGAMTVLRKPLKKESVQDALKEAASILQDA